MATKEAACGVHAASFASFLAIGLVWPVWEAKGLYTSRAIFARPQEFSCVRSGSQGSRCLVLDARRRDQGSA